MIIRDGFFAATLVEVDLFCPTEKVQLPRRLAYLVRLPIIAL